MTYTLLYLFVGILVFIALDSIDINKIYKKNKVFQARLFYFLLALSITYIITSMIMEFSTKIKIF